MAIQILQALEEGDRTTTMPLAVVNGPLSFKIALYHKERILAKQGFRVFEVFDEGRLVELQAEKGNQKMRIYRI